MKKIVCILTGLLCVSQAPAFDVIKDEATVKISDAGKTVLEYRFGDVPFKPYVAQLCTPAGVPVLRDSPFDHKHHHSLMFAVAAVGVDFWTEQPNCGKQLGTKPDTGSNSLMHRLEWRTPAGKQVLNEARTITLNENKDVTLITWHSRLGTPADTNEVTLTGSHYFGLGMRFVTNLDVVATFMYASGKTGDVVRGTERLTSTSWCACSGPAAGKFVTVALFDHPSNLHYPSRMFTMTEPFSYLSATLNLWKEPFILRAGKTLDLRYGIALWDGKVSTEQIEKTYRIWLSSIPPQQEGMRGQRSMRGPMSEVRGQMPMMHGMANQGRQMPGEPTPRRLFADPEALKAAGATEEQLLTFKIFMKEFRMKQIDLRASIEKAELAFQLLEAEPKSDEATLLKATDDISNVKAEMLRQETLMKTKTKSIFGEDIIKKLFENNHKKQIQRQQQPNNDGRPQATSKKP